METILGERYAPVTSAAGFVEAPLDAVTGAFAEWRRGLRRGVKVREVTGFPDMLRALEPLTNMGIARELLVETRGPRTSTTGCRLPTSSARSATSPARCGGPGSPWTDSLRAVTLTQDVDGWTFGANGPVQPFEETARYGARRVRDRFTADMLERYCAALGISLFDTDWYGPRGVLVDNGFVPKGNRVLSISIAEAQRRQAIVPDPAP